MMLFSSMVAIPFLIPLIWGIVIKQTPSWAGWTTVLVGLAVSLATSKYLDLDIVRSVIGLDTPLTKRERDEVLFFTSLFLNVGVASLWFLATTFFARFNSPRDTPPRVDAFFERLNRPLVSDPAETRAMDRTQLRTLGILGFPYGIFVILLAAIPNPLGGRLSFLLSGGAILLVSFILYRAARRIPPPPPSCPFTSALNRAKQFRSFRRYGRVAHLDRVSASEAEGSGFDSRRAHKFKILRSFGSPGPACEHRVAAAEFAYNRWIRRFVRGGEDRCRCRCPAPRIANHHPGVRPILDSGRLRAPEAYGVCDEVAHSCPSRSPSPTTTGIGPCMTRASHSLMVGPRSVKAASRTAPKSTRPRVRVVRPTRA